MRATFTASVLAAAAAFLCAMPNVAAQDHGEVTLGAEMGVLGSGYFFPLMPSGAARAQVTSNFFATGAVVVFAHDIVEGRTETFSSGYTGLRVPTENWTFGGAVQLGAHTVSELGPAPDGMSSSPSSTLLFTGVRLEAATAGNAGARWSFSLSIERDLTHGHVVVAETSCPITSFGCGGTTVTREVGGTTVALALGYSYAFYRF